MYKLNVQTIKLLTLHRVFNRNSDIDRHRTIGGRGLLSVLDTIRKGYISFGYHFSKSAEPLLRQVLSQEWFSAEEFQSFKAHIDDYHLSALLEKALHGQFYSEVLDSDWQWHWLQLAKFTRETDGAAQEQALTINGMRAKNFHLDYSPLCCLY